MKTSQHGIDLIKAFEGFRGEAYLCPAGVWTFGYGTTKAVAQGDTCSEEVGESLLRRDVSAFERAVTRLVKVPVSQNQFDALVSLAYNIGVEALRKSTLIAFLNQGKYHDAAAQFLRWNRGGGRILPGLVRRRTAERELFLRGDN
jgi:lysozyme